MDCVIRPIPVARTTIDKSLMTYRMNFGSALIVPGMHTNVLDAFDSIQRIKEAADVVVPCHEPGFWEGTASP